MDNVYVGHPESPALEADGPLLGWETPLPAQLLDSLSSTDPAIRFEAIQTIEAAAKSGGDPLAFMPVMSQLLSALLAAVKDGEDRPAGASMGALSALAPFLGPHYLLPYLGSLVSSIAEELGSPSPVSSDA
jgi:hypothetical protein